MIRITINFLWLIAGLVAAVAVAEVADPLADHRALFVEARKSLKAGRLTSYRELASQLEDYPLYPYLRYAEIRRYWSRQSDKDIQHFLDRYSYTPLAARLRHYWLRQLGEQKERQRFLAFYQPTSSIELQCYWLQATLTDPPSQDWLDRAQRFWLVGSSQPDSCDPVFDTLYASPRMTDELVWKRIRLAFARGKSSLAAYLARRLPETDQRWVTRWQRAHYRPARALKNKSLHKDSPTARAIMLHALGRIARRDAASTHEHWMVLRDKYDFIATQRNQLERRIALYSAYQDDPEASTRLNELSENVVDSRVRQWRARTALRKRDWTGVKDAISHMSPSAQADSEWRYWKGRALEQLDRRIEAMELFSALAGERNYHGFLAADYLKSDYAFNHHRLTPEDSELDALLAGHPALVRARELFLADMLRDARREWRRVLRTLTPRELRLAAIIAHRWGWHDRAILTAAQAGYLDDLELRFPVPYENHVEQVAKRFDLEPAWIMGVMRQESAFMPDARSPAGALGLMQLMPATGRKTARLLALPKPNRWSLLQTDRNIRLGSGYLRHVLDRFNGNQVLATAAYNAGPHRVDRWLPDDDKLPADVWVDTIPFTETRGYVRAVLAFTTVYESKLNPPITRLSKRMSAVPSAEEPAP